MMYQHFHLAVILLLLLPTGADAFLSGIFCYIPILDMFLCNECTFNVDEPCGEHGDCVDGTLSFTCDCDPGFTGDLCDTSDCIPDNPCLNGGTCVDDVNNGFTCTCPAEFSGPTCQNECGDGACDATEDDTSCPADCAVCGDGACNGIETAASCPADCAVCGDGLCNGGETAATCPADCQVCGDGLCNGGETAATCPADCVNCGDGVCEGTETAASCPADCVVCGDGTCENPETCSDCPADCGECCDCPDTPELFKWNGFTAPQFQLLNSNYNYALNQKLENLAIPGVAGAGPLVAGDLNCFDVTARAVADGLVDIGGSLAADPGDCPVDTCLVALLVWPTFEAIFLRQNDNSDWSLKLGIGVATTKDAANLEMGADLQGIDSGPFQFCSYMCTPCDATITGARRDRKLQVVTEYFDLQIVSRLGVPNPGWTPDQGEKDIIEGLLDNLTPTVDPNWPVKWAGYTGFANVQGGTIFRVWDGVIQIGNQYYLDDNGLENHLISEAIGRGFGSEVPEVGTPEPPI